MTGRVYDNPTSLSMIVISNYDDKKRREDKLITCKDWIRFEDLKDISNAYASFVRRLELEIIAVLFGFNMRDDFGVDELFLYGIFES